MTWARCYVPITEAILLAGDEAGLEADAWGQAEGQHRLVCLAFWFQMFPGVPKTRKQETPCSQEAVAPKGPKSR